jgi:hypothetical protein
MSHVISRLERLPLLIVAVAAVLLAAFAWQVALPGATRLTNGFSAYYTAARLLRAGSDAARFYDDAWFQAQTLQLGFANARDIFNVNPPAAALLLWPLAGLAPGAAKAVWTGLNLLLAGASLLLATRLAGGSVRAGALFVALATLYQPLREEIRLGQAYALLLLLEVAFAWAYCRGRDSQSGFWLGLLLALKTAGLALPALLIAQRRWRALAWTGATVVGVIAMTLPLLGGSAWLTYAGLLTRVGAHPELAVTAYQSLPGFFLHLFRADPTWNPAPLWDFPSFGTALMLLSGLALIGATFAITGRADPGAITARQLGFAAWAILSVVLNPGASDYHYTLLLAPMALLVARWRAAGSPWSTGSALALGVLLVGLPLPYLSPALAAGGWALLAYPKLYGALVLWAVAIGSLAQAKRSTPKGASSGAAIPSRMS